jgi:transcription initiation factor IIE alpha subunit
MHACIDIATVYEQAQCVYVVARLKLADCLVNGPKDVESLANELNVQVELLDRVLRYLYELGIFGRDRANRYTLTKVSEFLISDHPHVIRRQNGWLNRDQEKLHNSPLTQQTT